MSIFSKIMDAISFKGTRPTQTGQQPSPVPAAAGAAPQAAPAPHVPPAITATPLQDVDVEAQLAGLADGKNLNWRSSIVDLMKLLGIDSSLDNRKELARELGYTGALDGSAEMNIWLHKATMRKLAENGGKVPASMTD
ncbi:DUF3597 domain-containing protein [Novosphingobium sp. KCTC 2891]|uniref:DUF3597 domain-containing protein n=1 Tax=Novosphingobium sp. KCTC 2891 TaxID=2989730 RepID=UPI002221A3D7|nr:DUF3597 domain-containing protein [Novosphingobium sp. KCTC 2891]MCW1382478.1 DUF3597 domain-containing protein [Novosphingobium sp. KCTC 2891]